MGRTRTGLPPGNPNARPLDPAAKCLDCGAYPRFTGSAWVIDHRDHAAALAARDAETVRKLAVMLHRARHHRDAWVPRGCPGPTRK